MPLNVLVVCTGNICRSPLTAMLLADRLGTDAVVTSAGTGALVGAPMPEPARRLAQRLGARGVDAHAGTQLTELAIQRADLVLALAREHRRAVVELVPAATRRTFTLAELALVASTLEPSDVRRAGAGRSDAADAMRGALALATASRAQALRGVAGDALDVIDPYRRSEDVYERSGREIAAAIEPVAAFLECAAEGAAA